MPEAACRLASLPSLGAIAVTGPDALAFLAAQLSQAPPEPGTGRAPLAAWHDAKGRVQALFRVVVGHDGGYQLITHSSVVDEVATSLRRYVLRAEVTIDVPADLACAAVLGDSAPWLAENGIELDIEAGASAIEGDVAWLRLAPELVHAVAATDKIEQLAAELPSGSAAVAELAEIHLGIPTVSAELRGQFLPQMLNLDVLGGVASDKGCYPGQEIIARAQNLGTVKRRLLRFTRDDGSALPAAGSKLQDVARTEVGTVVRAARSASGIELLAVMRLDAVRGPLATDDAPDLPLSVAELPYAIPGVDV